MRWLDMAWGLQNFRKGEQGPDVTCVSQAYCAECANLEGTLRLASTGTTIGHNGCKTMVFSAHEVSNEWLSPMAHRTACPRLHNHAQTA